jgi:hypothetical protein
LEYIYLPVLGEIPTKMFCINQILNIHIFLSFVTRSAPSKVFSLSRILEFFDTVLKFFTNQKMICPITQDNIKQPAITIFGNIYESNAIREWLEDNITDPCTNQILPVLYLFEPKQWTGTIEDLAKCYAKNARHWCWFMGTIDWYKQKNPTEMKKIRGTAENIVATEYIKTEKQYHFYLDKEREEYKIPDGALMRSLFIRQEKYNAFKSMNLVAADLRGSTFIDCVFGDCNFSFADISNCLFFRCTFMGNTCFYDTDINEETKFIDCKCEETWEWTTWKDRKSVYRLLRQRGLYGLKVDGLIDTG